MPKVEFTNTTLSPRRKGPPERRSLDQVGLPNPGPSSRGSTYWKSMLACPREHALANVLRIYPTQEQEALTVGLLVHYALESYYKSLRAYQQARLKYNTKRDDAFFWGGHSDAVNAAYAAIQPLLGEPGYDETVELVDRILSAYFQVYKNQDRWEILAVEENLEWHGVFSYTARIDMIVYDRAAGGMYIVEHKTARHLSDDLLDNYEMDWQILGQMWLVQKCVDLSRYPPFLGVYINLATKHKTPRLLRVPVNPSKAHLQEFERNFARWERLQREFARAGWPKSLGHCSGYARGYSKCRYYGMCHDFPAHGIEDWKRDNPPLGYERAEEED